MSSAGGPAARLEFRLLGPLEIWRDGRPVRLGGARQRDLLALLLLQANEVVSSDRLVEEVFGGHAPQGASNALQAGISRLRRILENGRELPDAERVIVTRAPGYLLRIDPDQLDVTRFERLLDAGRGSLSAGDAPAAIAKLREALGLWRGPPVADLSDRPLVAIARRRLEELRLTALMERLDAELALGLGPELVAEVEALAAANPLQERLRGQLMLALYRSGRQSDALETYRATRALLSDELGLEPSRALQELERAILRHDPALGAAQGLPSAYVAAPRRETIVCPFKGLAPFDADDAEYFCGREQLVSELVARLVGASLIGVVGASGSGKSSLLRAGLLSALATGALPGSDRWRQVVIRPGEHPLRVLEGALQAAGRVDGPSPAGRSERLVLAVDQLEELFTSCSDERERAAFVSRLVELAREQDGRVVVVLALRADFYGDVASHPDLAAMLTASHTLLGPMRADELRRAIELPARRAGLAVEPELVAALLSDVVDEPGGLPLLSAALLELWQRREGRLLRLEHYSGSDGVRGAVARLAEDAFRRLTPSQQRAARTMLLRLAGLGEDDRPVPRPVPLTELDAGGNPDVQRVLELLTESRLLTTSNGTVEVAHEALLQEWPRLRTWLEEDAEARRTHRHLRRAAREWRDAGREASELYRGARLAAALDRGRHVLELDEVETEFLQESRAASERERERQRRTNRRLLALLVGTGLLLLLALLAGAFALSQRGDARRAATTAEAQRLGSQALVEQHLDRALLLARAAVELDDSPTTRGDLLAALLRSPAAIAVLRRGGDRLLRNAISPDHRTLAVGGGDGTVVFFDTSTLRRSGRSFHAPGAIFALTFSPDGRLLAVGSSSTGGGVLDLVDARSHRARAEVVSQGATVDGVAFSPSGGALVTNDVTPSAGTTPPTASIVLRDPASGHAIGPSASVSAGMLGGFTHGGHAILATAGERKTILLDPRTLGPLRSFPLGGRPALSPNGSAVALGHSDGAIDLLDLRSGRRRRTAEPARAAIDGMSFNRDGTLLAAALANGDVTLWDVGSGRERETFKGHAGSAQAPVWSGDGTTLFTSGLDSSVIAWDVTGRRRLGRRLALRPPGRAARQISTAAAITPTGSAFVTSSRPGEVTLWSAKTLRRIGRPFTGFPGAVYGLAFDPEGRVLAATGSGGATVLWDVRRRSVTRRTTSAQHGASGVVAFSPDGRLFATGLEDGTVIVYETADGAKVAELHSAGAVEGATFSPNGKLLATASDDGGVVLWRVEDGSRLRTLQGSGQAASAVQFSPDGKLIAVGSPAGIALLWDIGADKWVGPPLAGQIGPVMLTFAPDGSTLATSAFNGDVRLWDVGSHRQIGAALPGPSGPGSISFFPDGRNVLTVHASGAALVWSVDPASWKERACAIAGRELTRSEWKEFLPDQPYRSVCASPG